MCTDWRQRVADLRVRRAECVIWYCSGRIPMPLDPEADDFLGKDLVVGPNDIFEISSNNPPDLPEEDEDVIEPQDYTGDYPLEGEDGEE